MLDQRLNTKFRLSNEPNIPYSEVFSETTTDHFFFFRQSTITSFFIENLVDVPVCFKKSKSLYSLTFELHSMKFINLIMRKGMKEKVFSTLTNTLYNIFLHHGHL